MKLPIKIRNRAKGITVLGVHWRLAYKIAKWEFITERLTDVIIMQYTLRDKNDL